jgi:hypothetical protein
VGAYRDTDHSGRSSDCPASYTSSVGTDSSVSPDRTWDSQKLPALLDC